MTAVLKKIDWTKPLECNSRYFLDTTYIGKHHDVYVVVCTTPGGYHYSCTVNEYGQCVSAVLKNTYTVPFVYNKKTKKSGWAALLRIRTPDAPPWAYAPYLSAVYSSKEALLQSVEHLGLERLSEPVEFTWEE